MSRYVGRRTYTRLEPWTLGPAWPEPLVTTAPLRLACAVIAHAVTVDLKDPRRTAGVFTWLLDVLPDEGPVSKRMILPRVIATVEGVLQGEMSKNAKRHGRKLAPHHRATLARLIREHKAPATV